MEKMAEQLEIGEKDVLKVAVQSPWYKMDEVPCCSMEYSEWLIP